MEGGMEAGDREGGREIIRRVAYTVGHGTCDERMLIYTTPSATYNTLERGLVSEDKQTKPHLRQLTPLFSEKNKLPMAHR